MAFLVRGLHVGSVSFILGGALLLLIVFYLHRTEPFSSPAVMLKLMQAYEYGFWAAMGLIVATGVGNVAHFGEGLPGSESTWGGQFIVKLALVGLLLLFSTVRVLALHLVQSAPTQTQGARMGVLEGMYGATAVLGLGIGGLAVALTHF